MINGQYYKNILHRSQHAPDETTLWGASNFNTQYAPFTKTERKCKTINFWLYKADYFTNKKNWYNLSPATKQKCLEDLYELILVSDEYKYAVSFSVTPFYRRTRLFK